MSTITKDMEAKVPKKKVKFVLIAIIVIVTFSYFYFNRPVLVRRINKLRHSPCFLKRHYDLLPKIETRVNPLARNIFFVEKECGEFTARFACAVEAAALANPEMQVNVLFIGPAFNVRKLVAIQTQFPNVKFVRINLENFAKSSDLKFILNQKSIRYRRILKTGTLDIVKYWILNKYGGIYLDKNMIVIGPLAKYSNNWIVRKSRYSFAIEPLGLLNDAIGHVFFHIMSKEILKFYQRTLQWDKKPSRKYGRLSFSDLLEKAMKKFCKTSYTPIMTSKNCRGLKIYRQEELYPPEWDDWSYFLETGELEQHHAYLFPLLRNIPKDKKILNTSRYARLVSQFCPMTAHAQGNDFEWLKDFTSEDYMQHNNITREIITVI
ncbi:lactosylceramide 4-alpha-galactosyltransferase-like [Hyposmocoma kahamanoa]|uniref:lactosylceramide 4-alpha-galactosyltransferase-like n=1 Tax=Hyposmocoma kahamanoa TaxID=1477025 RepID=UPI000E6D8B8D|nr:lactosylceramide 4-alpha-galactosyltransferase-like [Hyposmocoma kahamanoa]